MTTVRAIAPADLDRIIATLAAWEPEGGTCAWLQAGDIGWMLRFGREHTARSLVEWVSPAGDTVLILCRDSAADWWFAMEPAHWLDRELAESFAEWVVGDMPAGLLSIDGPHPPATWRQALVERGFEATIDTWAHLWLPLDGRDVAPDVGIESTENPENVADRVAVQKAAFERSTFTVERWHQMASEAVFEPRFDLLVRAPNSEPASAATFWLPGPGKCARLEPLGTHPDHRRQGHGRRLIAGAAALLRQAGASGIGVVTPESNTAAVELYRAAGFRRVGLLSAMVRPGD